MEKYYNIINQFYKDSQGKQIEDGDPFEFKIPYTFINDHNLSKEEISAIGREMIRTVYKYTIKEA